MNIIRIKKDFLYCATCIYLKSGNFSILVHKEISEECFQAIYGLTVLQMAVTWRLLYNKFLHPKAYQKKYLLWTLRFLKHYQTKRCLSHDLKSSPNTVFKWVCYTVKCLAKLKLVSLLEVFDWLIYVTYRNNYFFLR